MSYVGINIGALTVKVVAVHSDVKNAKVMAHQGRPLEVLEQLLAMPEFADAEYFGVSGHLATFPNSPRFTRSARGGRRVRRRGFVGRRIFSGLYARSWKGYQCLVAQQMCGRKRSCRTTNVRPEAENSLYN